MLRIALTAAALVLAGTVISTIGGGEAERAATPPAPTADSGWTAYAPLDDCAGADDDADEQAARLRESFAIFRDGTRTGDRPPLPEQASMAAWGEARELGGHIAVPVKVVADTCDPELAGGICFGPAGTAEQLACTRESEVFAAGLAFREDMDGGGELVRVLVPDGVQEVELAGITAPVEDDVATFELAPEQRGALVVGIQRYEKPPPDITPCSQVGKLDGDLPPEVAENFALFSQRDMSDYSQGGASFDDEPAAVYFRHGTTFRAAGVEFALVAGRVGDGSLPCDELEDGVCIGRLGRAEATCAAVADARREGIVQRVGDRLVVVVPDGVTRVRMSDGRWAPVRRNVAVAPAEEGVRVELFERR